MSFSSPPGKDLLSPFLSRTALCHKLDGIVCLKGGDVTSFETALALSTRVPAGDNYSSRCGAFLELLLVL